jgi:ABC-type lipoprotein export system ATPase subunit
MNDNKFPIIQVKNLSHEFVLPNNEISKILHEVSFEINHGGFTIIHGPSGSGKSTLLNIIVGLIPPTTGQVIINQQDIHTLSADERAHFRSIRMGLVHQANYWVKSLSVIENVAMPLYMTGMGRKEAHKIAMDMLNEIGLAKYANYHPTVLSGGQQQRVSMARALISDPTLIVADEPTGNLDSKNGDMIMNLLNHIRKEKGKTILLVTHDLRYLPFSDHQLSIQDGVVTESHHRSSSHLTNANKGHKVMS